MLGNGGLMDFKKIGNLLLVVSPEVMKGEIFPLPRCEIPFHHPADLPHFFPNVILPLLLFSFLIVSVVSGATEEKGIHHGGVE
jgi:hypothetical protein